MAITLTHGQQRPVAGRRAVLLHAVIAGDVSGINARVIRRLEPAGSRVALGEDTVAVRAVHQLSPPRGHAAIPVSEMSLAASQELVRQLEIEIVATPLWKSAAVKICSEGP